MPVLSPNSEPILDGAVVLTQRDGSANWQARFKIAGRWHRVSTKTKNLIEAKDAARDQYIEAKYRAKLGVPVQSKRFKDVARLAVDRMQKSLAGGEGKKVYRDYIQAIDNYLIPFFGNHHIDALAYPEIKRFSAWRTEKIGRELKASTLNTHNSALNRIFDEAVMHGYMAKSQVPVLENKGRDAQRRPAFSLDEYEKLYRGLRRWAKQGRKGKSRAMRELLRDYVLILANTGIRSGTEAQNLRWRHVKVIKDNDQLYLEVSVDGKTGRRQLIARHACVTYLKRIHARCRDIAGIDFDEFLKSRSSDLPVFRLPDGATTKNLNQTFRAFLRHVGLLEDPDTGQKRTLYSLRHMYATFRILKGIDLHVLSRQMGTSIPMLEKHYSHLEPRMMARELAA